MSKTEETCGKVWLVGAGPSDAGLLTLKGKAVLEQADVVVFDQLVGKSILAMMPRGAKRISVGKFSGNHPVPQDQINQILLQEAQEGKRVVRLKGGDPFLFGRGGEELELLCENGIPYEVVPGVTSAFAVPAYHGIPVTHRDFCSSVHIITGHRKGAEPTDLDYGALVKLDGTLVFLMGVAAMAAICQGLLDAGMAPTMPAAVLERGTTAHQRRVVTDIAHLTEEALQANIQAPAIIVVGKVCGLAERFHWAEDRPLGKYKVMVTRPKDRSSVLTEKLTALGAEVLEVPTIETNVILDNERLISALQRLDTFHWVAFTSPFGVETFFAALLASRMDIRQLQGLRFAAIGSATQKAIEARGILVDLVPEQYHGRALGEALAQQMLQEQGACGEQQKVFIPRAKIGTEELLLPLQEAGLFYEDLPVYDTVEAPWEEFLGYDDSVDLVAFTSASTVRGFAKMVGPIDFTTVRALCIGEQTAQEASTYGMQITVAKKATIDSMVEALCAMAAAEKGYGDN